MQRYKMENIIKELLKLNIEIEGLLWVIESRDTEYARNVLFEKIQCFNALFASLDQIHPVSRDEMAVKVDDEISRLNENNNSGTILESIDRQDADNGDNAVVSEHIEMSVQQGAIATDDDAPIEVEAPSSTNINSSSKEQMSVSNTSNERDDSLRMDELLSRREAQDLRRAFTLNDKFRYRRELFGSNDAMFANALNTLSAMKSLDEALDFLYKDLNWDPDDDNVKDFVATVTNHFSAIK